MAEKSVQGLFSGGGEMGRRIRAFQWSKTTLGPVETWPQALRVAIRILLGSGFPMYIGWGPEFIQFYNDAYFPILGNKHPAALGIGTPETFAEIWNFIGPMFRRVMAEAEATTLVDQILFLERNGYPEECYFTFSYSPLPADRPGLTGGVLVTALETTDKVIEERRLTLLRDLAAATSEARGDQDVLRQATGVLQNNLHDMPFSLLYAYDPKTGRAALAGTVGVSSGHPIAPESLEQVPECVWPVHESVTTGKLAHVTGLSQLFTSLPSGPWSVPPQHAVVLPIQLPGQETPYGFLVAAINPHKKLDARYEAFLERAARQIARNLADARAYQEERRRAEELAALDRAKTAFFSNVSHEFRTPLTLMLGPLEDLLSRSESHMPEDDRQQLLTAHRNSLRLLKLVNTILDFSRIEAGRIQATYQPTDLATFTAGLAGVFESTMQRGGLRYQVQCLPVDGSMFVDRDMWEKLVLNLLSNAFKFTLQGEVRITLGPADGGAELTVSDTG
ncbi:MAG TPA: GAF domain-containing sensor histidine kinase, partial [Candidatus Elarobacter sp.]|nr:GAF domain-containing sensor histidine kinase [Candidatus Elarobacter sp.]